MNDSVQKRISYNKLLRPEANVRYSMIVSEREHQMTNDSPVRPVPKEPEPPSQARERDLPRLGRLPGLIICIHIQIPIHTFVFIHLYTYICIYIYIYILYIYTYIHICRLLHQRPLGRGPAVLPAELHH